MFYQINYAKITIILEYKRMIGLYFLLQPIASVFTIIMLPFRKIAETCPFLKTNRTIH